MNRLVQVSLISMCLVLTMCGGGYLTRTQWTQLPDKSFSLEEVNIQYQQPQYCSNTGADTPAANDELAKNLPVDAIARSIEAIYHVKVNTSDFRKVSGKITASPNFKSKYFMGITQNSWSNDVKKKNAMKIYLAVGCGGRDWFYYNVRLFIDGEIVADVRDTTYIAPSMENWINQEKIIPQSILGKKQELLWD